MNTANEKKPGWKKRITRELTSYSINFIYLAVFFGLFTWYRRLVLAAYHIEYLHYGYALIEAAILAKVIMIGDYMRLGRKFENKPLIVPTLYNMLLFSLWIAAFSVFERIVTGLVGRKDLAEIFRGLLSQNGYEVLAGWLVKSFALLPLFVFRALDQVLGERRIFQLFFGKRGRQKAVGAA